MGKESLAGAINRNTYKQWRQNIIYSSPRYDLEKGMPGFLFILGGADFVPALSLIESHGKEVLTAMAPFGYSSELRKKFPFFILRKETLMKCLRNYAE